MQPTAHCVILCTCPNTEVAKELAHRLLNAHLVACVNLVDRITSLFRWEGAVAEEAEVLMVIKTTSAQAETVAQQLIQHHPYDVPEVIALPITAGAQPYLEWISTCTQRPS